MSKRSSKKKSAKSKATPEPQAEITEPTSAPVEVAEPEVGDEQVLSDEQPAETGQQLLDMPYEPVDEVPTEAQAETAPEGAETPVTEDSAPPSDPVTEAHTEPQAESPTYETGPEATVAPEAPAAPEATPAKTKKSKAKKDAGPKKLSALDAAAQVLKEAGQPMTCSEMIEAMSKQGLWSSPNGATPAATLYSAILRELKKGEASRFVKADRGKFVAKT